MKTIKKNTHSPKQGLHILQALYEKNPTHQGIKNNLISAYIRFGYHDEAIAMINALPKNKTDAQTLRWRAWVEHKNGNFHQEKQLWASILPKSIKIETSGIIRNFTKCDTREIFIKKDDIVFICVSYNEMLRLPFLLKYYRDLGITKFFFVDNNSNDGGLEFLSAQPDCHVFWTDDSYNESGSGIRWVHHILDTYIPQNQWCIHADTDEFLIYPHYEHHKLEKLTAYLDRYGYNAVSSFMLDTFPKDIKSQLSITPNDDLLKSSPYFYNNYEFYHKDTSPYINPVGGIFQHYDIYEPRTKTALFKNDKQLRFLSATHMSTPTKIADISSAYFHLKMLGDFHKKAIDEQKRKEHAGGGRVYKQYARMYESFGDENFDFTTLPKTKKYESSQQLIDLKLIKTSNQWEDFIQNPSDSLASHAKGLSILENLNQKFPEHELITNNLINIYIRLNKTDEAIQLIKQKPVNEHNIQSLKYYAYLAHQENDTEKELSFWLKIFHKSLHFLSDKERNYFLSQATTQKKKISLCQQGFSTLFNYAHYSLPVQLQNLLGNEIKNAILIANNHEITLNHLHQHIQHGDLIVCFNFSIFMNFYQHFPDNPKLFLFRKSDNRNHHYFGLPQASISNRSYIDIDFDEVYEVIRQPSTYLLFNENLPHTLDLPEDIYQKIYNPQFTGLLSQFHKIFDYLEPHEYYFNSTTLPSSGFMAFKYLYYTRLHLLNDGKSDFNIKLLGFNFTDNSFYQTHGVHNWTYERSQMENLPDGIERIIIG